MDPETLALEVIKKVGVAGSFLKEQHTIKKMREEIWYPALFNRNDWVGWAKRGCADMLKKAQEELGRILKDCYPPMPVVDKDVADRLTEIERDVTRTLAQAT